MRPFIAELRKLGAELCVVGNGAPHFARGLRDEFQLDVPIYCDQKLEAYAAAGLKRGLSTVLKLGALTSSIKAFRRGARQTSLQGDPWQQGGAFVILPGGRVVYSQVSQALGDHADPNQFLSALRSAAAAA